MSTLNTSSSTSSSTSSNPKPVQRTNHPTSSTPILVANGSFDYPEYTDFLENEIYNYEKEEAVRGASGLKVVITEIEKDIFTHGARTPKDKFQQVNWDKKQKALKGTLREHKQELEVIIDKFPEAFI